MIDGYTLVIEGATYAGSVALLTNGSVVTEHDLAETRITGKQGRPEGVLPAVEDCLQRAGIVVTDIARIVCGAGPGSFTSLRIAASVAKGLASGVGIPLFAAPSLALTVAAAGLGDGRYISTLDAMRGEAYALGVELFSDGRLTHAASASRVRATELEALTQLAGARIVGPGREIDARPKAAGALAFLESIVARGPVKLGEWEPDYGRAAEAQVRWEERHGPLEAAQ